jgi:hypothetical protein
MYGWMTRLSTAQSLMRITSSALTVPCCTASDQDQLQENQQESIMAKFWLFMANIMGILMLLILLIWLLGIVD